MSRKVANAWWRNTSQSLACRGRLSGESFLRNPDERNRHILSYAVLGVSVLVV